MNTFSALYRSWWGQGRPGCCCAAPGGRDCWAAACLLSGVLFGAAHLTNLSSSAPFGVLMQCAFSASLGALFAAIYFRTGNLWVTVFLHGAMDIASMLIGGLYGTTTLSESVSGYDASMLLTVVVYLLPVAFLLRKKKLPEVQLYWGAYTQK